MGIESNVQKILSGIPPHVNLEAAAKTRTGEEVQRAIDAGVRIIGENYLQEGEKMIGELGSVTRWHYIGHLQSNKIKKIVSLFDMIETVGSLKYADLIDKHAEAISKTMPVLVEINSGKEEQKNGIYPDDANDFIREVSSLENIRVSGLMTMGRHTGGEDVIRKCFSNTKALFDEISSLKIKNCNFEYLSMGMSSSYQIAIEEGANIIRVGEGIFGPRNYSI